MHTIEQPDEREKDRPRHQSKHLDASRQFYVGVLGLEVAMDMGFIVTLVSPSNATAQVSLMRDDDSSTILPSDEHRRR
jgi:catechol 2,3-dioxygenase-like lactoylglutathione lyase family enzyme